MFIDNIHVDIFIRGIVLTTFAMIWVVILVRINGLRSFSKMTNFDFVMTVAIGSLLAGASQSSQWTGFMQSVCAMAALFAVQYTAARLRKASDTVKGLMQNEPILLMENGVLLHEALTQVRVAPDDIMAKLREANALDLSQVHAVVLETTGDISVLHGPQCAPELLDGIRRVG